MLRHLLLSPAFRRTAGSRGAVVLALGFGLALAGCEPPSDGTSAPPPSAAAPAGAVPAAAPVPVAAEPVRLSAGTALPQTGPEGTLMLFSVDYQFTLGEPVADRQYIWVITRGNGTPKEIESKLTASGTLTTVLNDWRPEEDPFSCRIDEVAADGTRKPVSQTEVLR